MFFLQDTDEFPSEGSILCLPDYRRSRLVFDLGKRLLGIPERPPFLPGSTAVRMVEQEDATYSVLDAGGGPNGPAFRGPRGSALQPGR